MEQRNVYELYATKEENAINASRKIYEAKYPPPTKPKIQSNIWKFVAGFAVLLIASNIVSGAHTIPLFQRSISETILFGFISLKKVVGVSSFTMIEVGMVMLAISRIVHYTSMQRETWEHNNKQVSRFILVSIALIFGVALFANIYSTLTLSLENGQQTTNVNSQIATLTTVSITDPENEQTGGLERIASIILFTLMGSSAPVLTLLSGEVIGKVLVSENAKKDLKLKKWEEDTEAWNDAFLEDYRRRKGHGVWKVEIEEPIEQQFIPLNRPEKASSNALEPIKIRVDDKIKYECPSCHKVITRQAWSHHKCRYDS